jgi:Flp pilus assembly secretin CpaC
MPALLCYCGLLCVTFAQAERPESAQPPAALKAVDGEVGSEGAPQQQLKFQFWLVELPPDAKVQPSSLLWQPLEPLRTQGQSPQPRDGKTTLAVDQGDLVQAAVVNAPKPLESGVLPTNPKAVSAEVQRLLRAGQLKVIAEPTILTTLGRPAQFRSVGEKLAITFERGTPIEVAAAWTRYIPLWAQTFVPLAPTTTVTGELIEFGTRIEIAPTIIREETVRTRLMMGVSTRSNRNQTAQTPGSTLLIEGVEVPLHTSLSTVPGCDVLCINSTVDLPLGRTFVVRGSNAEIGTRLLCVTPELVDGSVTAERVK